MEGKKKHLDSGVGRLRLGERRGSKNNYLGDENDTRGVGGRIHSHIFKIPTRCHKEWFMVAVV